MNLVRHFSRLLRMLSLLIGCLYFATVSYIILSIVFRLSSFKIIENNHFTINYPFTSAKFILGNSFTFTYVFEVVVTMALYGLFFLLLANVFRAFMSKPLFTKKGIQRLKVFALYNFILPLVLALLFYILNTGEDFPVAFMIMAHFVIAIFAYFIMAIFKEGVGLQNEQDLFI